MTPLLVGLAWKSTVVLALAWACSWILRRRSAALRHTVWTAAFGVLLLLPGMTAALPSLTVSRQVPMGELLASITAAAPAAGPVKTAAAPAVGIPAPHPQETNFDPRPLLPIVWAAGTAFCLLRILIACLGIRKLRRRAGRLPEAEAERIAHGLGIRRPVEVLAVPAGEIPSSFGHTVFLPADSSQWDPKRRHAVLLHELAHVQRGDWAIQILGGLAWSVYWWNPLAWIAWRALIDERERSVDDVVLGSGVGASDYASHLMALARSVRPIRISAPLLVAMARQSKLEVRIMAILDANRDRRAPGRFAVGGMITAALVLIAPIAAIRAQDTEASPADPEAAIKAAVNARSTLQLEKMAHEAIASADYARARKLMKASLEITAMVAGERSMEYGRALLFRAEVERRAGDTEGREIYRKAIEVLGDRPESAPGLIALALYELSANNFEEAARMLENAAKLDPNSSARATMWLGVIREKQGRLDDAQALFLSAQKLAEPKSGDAATILELHAQLLQSRNQPKEAAESSALAVLIRKDLGASTFMNKPPRSGVLEIGNGVTPPKLLEKVEPEYSQEARLAKYQGSVLLSVEIGPNGTAQDIRVVRGLGLELNEKAAAAIRKWKFKPATKDGQPVAVAAKVEVNFRLL